MLAPKPQVIDNTKTEVKQPDPIRIPSPMDADVIQARKEKMQKEMQDRQGKQSTNLSGATPPSGASAAYSRTTLG